MQITKHESVIEPKFAQLLGKRAGLVSGLYLTLQTREVPNGALSQPISCDVGQLAGAHGELDLSVGGKGETVEDSFMSSIGELVERYCMCFPPEAEELALNTYEEMAASGNTVDFEHLDIYDDESTDELLDSFDRDTEIYWGEGTNLLTGESVHVPAELVWLNVGPIEHDQHFLGTSNATAAGSSLEDALLGAILEGVERDGFMRTWCKQETPSRVDLDAFPEIKQAQEERMSNEFLESHAFVYDSPIDIPALGAAAVNTRDEVPKFIMGGGAGPNFETALNHTFVEVIQGWPFVTEIAMDQGFDDVSPATPGDNFEENVLYYGLPENFEEIEHLVSGEKTVPDYPEEAEDWDNGELLDYCLDKIAEAGYTPIAFDLTTRDMLETDFRVTKVWIPELVPLTPPFVLPTEHPAFDGVDVTDRAHPYP